jgi:hypothetical protein
MKKKSKNKKMLNLEQCLLVGLTVVLVVCLVCLVIRNERSRTKLVPPATIEQK